MPNSNTDLWKISTCLNNETDIITITTGILFNIFLTFFSSMYETETHSKNYST